MLAVVSDADRARLDGATFVTDEDVVAVRADARRSRKVFELNASTIADSDVPGTARVVPERQRSERCVAATRSVEQRAGTNAGVERAGLVVVEGGVTDRSDPDASRVEAKREGDLSPESWRT